MELAKRRNWSDDEVDEMLKVIEQKHPGFIEKLIDKVSKANLLKDDERDAAWPTAMFEEMSGMILRHHTTLELSEMSDMKLAIKNKLNLW